MSRCLLEVSFLKAHVDCKKWSFHGDIFIAKVIEASILERYTLVTIAKLKNIFNILISQVTCLNLKLSPYIYVPAMQKLDLLGNTDH